MRTHALFVLIACIASLQSTQSQTNYWTQTSGPGTGYDVRSFTVNSLGHLFAGTWTDGTIWKTTDNGALWSKCGAIPDPNPVLSLCTNSRDHIFASVYLKGVFRSTDGGTSWQLKNSGLTDVSLRSSLIDDSAFVWVATGTGLFSSRDNGDSWALKKAGGFSSVFFDSAHAIVTDDGSAVYRSLNHGVTWTTISRTTSLGLGGVHPDGSYYGANGSSAIFRSTDLGATWTDLHSGVTWSGFTDAFTFNLNGDIYYGRDGYTTGILFSQDKGKTWTPLNSGLTTTRVIPMFHHPNGYVFLGTNGAGVFRTRLQTDTLRAVTIDVPSLSYDFGKVRIGRYDTLSIQLSNRGVSDTLRIVSIISTNPHFRASTQAILIPPHGSQSFNLTYAPTLAAPDSGFLEIASNDVQNPVLSIATSGQGYDLAHAPLISGISYVSNSNSQARMIWFRSLDDSVGALDQTTQYSIWRRVPGTGVSGNAAPAETRRAFPAASADVLWDFIEVVPAIALNEYAAEVPVPYGTGTVKSWVAYIVVAQTKSMHSYVSAPDSILDPLGVTGIDRESAADAPGELVLRQNFPNPFNPSTTIQYALPTRSNVSLIVYNALGQVVATLVDEEEEAGYHEARFDGSHASSGVYFCRLKAGLYVKTGRLLLVR